MQSAKLVDRFEIVRPLGAGGMGVVYEALDTATGARVAVKTIEDRDGHALYQFKREFRSVADVTHPNLVQLHELVVQEDGTCVFSMEIVDGGVDLMRWVRAGIAPRSSPPDRSAEVTRAPSRKRAAITSTEPTTVVDRAAPGTPDPSQRVGDSEGGAVDLGALRETFRQLVLGVDAIHRAGKLHRDLKPSNVLVRPDGRVTILDFGLAAELREAPTAQRGARHGDASSSSGSSVRHYDSTDRAIAGTVLYMSPEQAEAQALTPASDWYAVGVMLFEALTGELPIEGPGLTVLLQKMAVDAPAPSTRTPGVPPDLDALCLALLSRAPEDRPSAARMLEVLTGAGSEHEVDSSVAIPFVGRSAAMQQLEGALSASRERAVVVRVRGPSGIGKSALVARFLGAHAADAWVCEGRCFEQETVPFKALDGVVDALARLIARRDPEARTALVPAEIGAVARMFPVMGAYAPSPESGAADELRARALAGLEHLLRRLATERAVILHVDDLQWGDEGGVSMLSALLASGAPFLLVLGSRSEYEGRSAALRALGAVERSLGDGSRWRTLDVGKLDDEAAGSVARAIDPTLEPALLRRVIEEAEGNAFFIQELARAARKLDGSSGGAHLDALLRARFAALDPGSRALLEACALASRPLPLKAALQIAGIESASADAARRLRAERLVRGGSAGLENEIETAHDRVREAVVGVLSSERRRALHSATARVLAGSSGIEPEAIAAHHEAAGELDAARRFYLRAADAAARALGFERAELFLHRALGVAAETSARAEVREQRVHFLTNLGRFADAYAEGREALREVGVEVPAGFSPPVLLAGLARLAWQLRSRDPAAIAALPEATDEKARVAVRLLAATMKAAYQVRPELCVTLANHSVSLCLAHGNTPDCAIGYMVHGAIFRGGVLGHLKSGHAYGRLALALVDRYDNAAQRAEVSFVVGYFATAWLRPAEEAEALFERALVVGLETGDDFHVGCAAAGLAMSRVMRGAPAEEILDHGVRHLELLRARRLDEPAATLEAALALTRRLRDGAPMPAGEDEAKLARYGSRHFAHFQLLARAIAAWHDGDEALARAILRRAEAHLPHARGMLHEAEHVFWRALSARPRDPRVVRDVRLLSRWASVGEDAHRSNLASKAALVGALARPWPGLKHRLRAVEDHARLTGRPHVAALAAEIARRRAGAPQDRTVGAAHD